MESNEGPKALPVRIKIFRIAAARRSRQAAGRSARAHPQPAADTLRAQAERVEWPVDVALARPVTQLPTGPSWAYEIKLWTGFQPVRCPDSGPA